MPRGRKSGVFCVRYQLNWLKATFTYTFEMTYGQRYEILLLCIISQDHFSYSLMNKKFLHIWIVGYKNTCFAKDFASYSTRVWNFYSIRVLSKQEGMENTHKWLGCIYKNYKTSFVCFTLNILNQLNLIKKSRGKEN